MACQAVVEASDGQQVEAIVALAAPTDLLADTERRGEVSKAPAELLDRQELNDETRLQLQALSPLNHVHNGLPPTLLIHGTSDLSVPYDQSVKYQEKLRAHGNDCDLRTIREAGHGINEWQDYDKDWASYMTSWLQETLSPPVNPQRQQETVR